MFKSLHQFFLAIDQLLNTLFYSSYDKEHYGHGMGYADETISARSWRLRNSTWFWNSLCLALDVIFFWDQGNHCYKSYMNEFKKHQLPKHYRDVLERYEVDVMDWDFLENNKDD